MDIEELKKELRATEQEIHNGVQFLMEEFANKTGYQIRDVHVEISNLDSKNVEGELFIVRRVTCKAQTGL